MSILTFSLEKAVADYGLLLREPVTLRQSQGRPLIISESIRKVLEAVVECQIAEPTANRYQTKYDTYHTQSDREIAERFKKRLEKARIALGRVELNEKIEWISLLILIGEV